MGVITSLVLKKIRTPEDDEERYHGAVFQSVYDALNLNPIESLKNILNISKVYKKHNKQISKRWKKETTTSKTKQD